MLTKWLALPWDCMLGAVVSKIVQDLGKDKGKNIRPRNSLSQRLETTENTSVVRERGQIGGVLADKPVQELLEGLSRELPEEDERVRLAEATLEPIEDGRLGGVVELLLQDGGPDPGASEQDDDAGEGDLGAGLDEDGLPVEQGGDDEGGEDAREVGEEAGEGARADGEVGRQPGAHEAVVEVADEEGRQQQQDAARYHQLEDGAELGTPGGFLDGDGFGAVLAPDLLRWAEEEGDRETQAHDDDEDDVGR